MKRTTLILTVFLAIIIGFSGTAQAQTGLLVESVQIQLWPEYDRPSMLVIFSIELSPDQAIPAPVSVRIPAPVGEPTAVAVLADSGLVTSEYTRTVEGGWAEITLEANSRFIQIEYYDPALSQQDQPRSYEFVWSTDFEINELTIGVKQPPTASGMEIVPDLGAGATATDGLLTFTRNLGSLPAGQEVQVSLSYTKADNSLVVENAPQAPVIESPAAAPSDPSVFPDWAWVIVGLGVVVLAAGAVIYFRSTGNAPDSSYKRKKKRAGSRSEGRASRAGTVFCHKCGTRAQSGDKFCRSCGTKLRL
ncbi:MAG: zinc ribbon domain-containing protein [Anaerolineales bacterium]|jgi:hypothetical protein